LNDLITTHLGAEQDGVNYGTGLAQSRLDAAGTRLSIKIGIFLEGANSYRAAVPDVRSAVGGGGGVLDPRTAWPVLRVAGGFADVITNFLYGLYLAPPFTHGF